VVFAILFWWESRQEGDVAENAFSAAEATAAFVPTFAVAQPTGEAPAEGVDGAEDAASESNTAEIYEVRAGDTLGSIASQYDVSVEDIMVANGLTDPNFLSVGQRLIIPVGGLPEATPLPAPTETSSAPPTPIPTLPVIEGEAVVGIAEVIGVGVLTEEAVSIVNSGSRPIALLGWQLLTADGRAYTFGQITLFGDGAAVLVHTEAGQDGPSDLFWGLEQPIWQPGSTVTLVDAEGTVQSQYVIESP
jgi:LysM repeat protein